MAKERGRRMNKLYEALDKLIDQGKILKYELSNIMSNGWIDIYLKIEETDQDLINDEQLLKMREEEE